MKKLNSVSGRALGLGIAAWLLVPAAGHSLSLLQNGDFSEGLAGWTTPEALHWWNPLTDGGTVLLEPPDWEYRGPVIRQPIDATVSGDLLVSGSILLRVNWGSDYDVSHQVWLRTWAPDTGEDMVLLADIIGEPDDPDEPLEIGIEPVPLPPGTSRITGFSIHIIGWGSYELMAAEVVLFSGEGSLHPVPEVAQIHPVSGPFGTPVVVDGANFGSGGVLTVGGSADGVSIQSWEDTLIRATLNEPARSGFVAVHRDGLVESLGKAAFHVESPTFQLEGGDPRRAFTGEEIKSAFIVSFHNGYNPPSSGLVQRVVDEAGEDVPHARVNREVIHHPGVYALTLDTTGMDPGKYRYFVEVVEDLAGAVARRLPVDVILFGVEDCLIYYWEDFSSVLLEEDTLTVTRQGELNLWFEFVPDGDVSCWEGSWNVGTVTSSNPSVVLPILGRDFWEFFSLYALRNGAADLTFTAPDGFSRTISVTVGFPESPQILEFSAHPPVVTNSGDDTIVHFGRATHAITIGTTGVEIWDSADPANLPVWSDGNRQVMRTATVRQDAPLGTAVLTLGTSGEMRSANVGLPVTVVNAPHFSAVLATPVGLGEEVFEGLVSSLSLFGADQQPEEDPLYEIWADGHGEPVLEGGIEPGAYRVRYDTWDGPGAWHDNAPDWASTEPVYFGAGDTIEFDVTYLGESVSFERQALEIYGMEDNAVIRLHRTGSVEMDLYVHCAVHPLTAEPGVDYGELWNDFSDFEVVFPKGSAEAEIVIPVHARSSTQVRTFLVTIQEAFDWGMTPRNPRSCLVSITSIALFDTPYELWAKGIDWQGRPSGMDDDANGNGLTNLLCYALGLDPVAPGRPEPFALTPGPSPNEWRIAFRRECYSLIYTVQMSSNLVDWQTVAVNPGDEGADVEVIASIEDPKFFVRIHVENP